MKPLYIICMLYVLHYLLLDKSFMLYIRCWNIHRVSNKIVPKWRSRRGRTIPMSAVLVSLHLQGLCFSHYWKGIDMLNRETYDGYLYWIFCEEYLTRLGCMPPWFTGNYSKVCNRTLSEEDIQYLSYSIVRHFDTDEYPECMRPCTRLNIRSRIMRLH